MPFSEANHAFVAVPRRFEMAIALSNRRSQDISLTVVISMTTGATVHDHGVFPGQLVLTAPLGSAVPSIVNVTFSLVLHTRNPLQ